MKGNIQGDNQLCIAWLITNNRRDGKQKKIGISVLIETAAAIVM